MIIKAGTKVEIGLGLGRVETGTILRWTKCMGNREDAPAGYHPIRFDEDGAQLMVYCGQGVRVIDNRPNRVMEN